MIKINWNPLLNIITVIGFIISVANSIYLWNKQRKNLSFKLFKLESFETAENVNHIFELLIENKSSMPISITNIKLIYDNKEYVCKRTPKFVGDSWVQFGDEILHKTINESFNLPINIDPFVSVRGYAYFTIPLNSNIVLKTDDFVEFLIGTSRGQINEFLIIPKTAAY